MKSLNDEKAKLKVPKHLYDLWHFIFEYPNKDYSDLYREYLDNKKLEEGE